MTFNKRGEKFKRTFLNVPNCLLVFSIGICITLISLPTDKANAQSVGDTSGRKTSVAIKVSSISPAAGVSYSITEKSELRFLGFVTTYSNLSAHDDQLFLDISFLRYVNWIKSRSFNTYWGLNLNMLAEDPLIGPGVLLGTSYYLKPKFALFAEVGLNFFIDGNGNSTIGLHNSGIGIKIGL